MPVAPPIWTEAQLDAERLKARAFFRQSRIEEPADIYSTQYEEAHQAVAELLERTIDLADLRGAMETILGDGNLFRALRYIVGPPISEDDLKTVAEVELSRRYLKNHPEAHDAIAESILMILDPKRFPWVIDEREPTEAERATAVVATAATIAYQRALSIRRNHARALEAEVADALVAAGVTEVAKRMIATGSDWPRPGEFCGEHNVAGRQADLIVTLFDGRYMPVECKVSGSALNSIKRLNNDSLAKFSDWTRAFGQSQTVPVAILEGVYALERLQAAQHAGASIFWSHSLDALRHFVEATKP